MSVGLIRSMLAWYLSYFPHVMLASSYVYVHSIMKNITSSENSLIVLQGLHVIPGDLMITLVINSYTIDNLLVLCIVC